MANINLNKESNMTKKEIRITEIKNVAKAYGTIVPTKPIASPKDEVEKEKVEEKPKSKKVAKKTAKKVEDEEGND